MQLVFAPNSDMLAGATRAAVEGALQQWLGELIEVGGVEVTNEDSTLFVRVQYTVRRTREKETAEFSRDIS